MSDSIKLKGDKPGTAAPAAVAPSASTPARLPEIEDSPRYNAAVQNLTRLKLDLIRLEQLRDDYQAAKDQQATDVQAVLRGKSAAQVRRDAVVTDADWRKVTQDIRLTRLAIEEAEREERRVEAEVKHEVCRPFASTYRARLRAAAVAYLAWCRAAAELDSINEHLQARSMAGYGGCVSPLPTFRGGNPITDKDAASGIVIRDLIDAGVVSETADAALLAGLQIAPPRPVYVEPPKPPEKKKEPGSLAKALKSLGVSFGDNW